MDVQQLVQQAIEQGILVTEEMLSDPEKLQHALYPYKIHVLESYTKPAHKRTTEDFIRHFNKRYREISSFLRHRPELNNVVSIGRLRGKRERENVSMIGMVMEKKETKNGHVVMKIEDPSGQIDVWVHADNKELIEEAKEIVHDEVLGIVGQTSNRRVFANSVVFPDIPRKDMLKGPRDAYAVFVGDVEVGNKLFMEKEFEQMISWLRGEIGSEEQRRMASKVGYVIFIGDLVHGVGIYPGQEEDLEIHDIEQQYARFTEFVTRIPPHIQVAIITGNHDAGRLQEPQLPVYQDLAPELYELPNVHVLSNPSRILVEKTKDFQGLEILMYHGYSLIYYAKEVQPIKDAGGLNSTQEVMKLYLRKRHLSPSHGSNTYVPDPDEDPMVISSVPDVLVTGHVHNMGYGVYNGVQMINPGCWNDVSDEQIKRGLTPEPARLPLLNLKTREMKIMNFYPGDK